MDISAINRHSRCFVLNCFSINFKDFLICVINSCRISVAIFRQVEQALAYTTLNEELDNMNLKNNFGYNCVNKYNKYAFSVVV